MEIPINQTSISDMARKIIGHMTDTLLGAFSLLNEKSPGENRPVERAWLKEIALVKEET